MSVLIDALFPKRCPFCTQIVTAKLPICGECIKSIPYIKGKVCIKCGIPLGEFAYDLCRSCNSDKRGFERAFIPLLYKDNVRSAIVRLKYSHHPSYAPAFAFLLADKLIRTEEFDKGFDFITFVPQSKSSLIQRGYNQTELIAKHLSKLLDIPVKDTLIRINIGSRQVTLNALQRRENVKKCYFQKDIKLNGTALLVDDVFTTGSTSSYCSKLLKKMGCSKVYAAVCAIRGMDDLYED